MEPHWSSLKRQETNSVIQKDASNKFVVSLLFFRGGRIEAKMPETTYCEETHFFCEYLIE